MTLNDDLTALRRADLEAAGIDGTRRVRVQVQKRLGPDPSNNCCLGTCAECIESDEPLPCDNAK